MIVTKKNIVINFLLAVLISAATAPLYSMHFSPITDQAERRMNQFKRLHSLDEILPLMESLNEKIDLLQGRLANDDVYGSENVQPTIDMYCNEYLYLGEKALAIYQQRDSFFDKEIDDLTKKREAIYLQLASQKSIESMDENIEGLSRELKDIDLKLRLSYENRSQTELKLRIQRQTGLIVKEKLEELEGEEGMQLRISEIVLADFYSLYSQGSQNYGFAPESYHESCHLLHNPIDIEVAISLKVEDYKFLLNKLPTTSGMEQLLYQSILADLEDEIFRLNKKLKDKLLQIEREVHKRVQRETAQRSYESLLLLAEMGCENAIDFERSFRGFCEQNPKVAELMGLASIVDSSAVDSSEESEFFSVESQDSDESDSIANDENSKANNVNDCIIS